MFCLDGTIIPTSLRARDQPNSGAPLFHQALHPKAMVGWTGGEEVAGQKELQP